MQLRLRNVPMMGIIVIALLIASVVGSYAASATYTYDELNRLIRVEYENGAITDYYYDEVGNRTSTQQVERKVLRDVDHNYHN